jgi:hypothetical protein
MKEAGARKSKQRWDENKTEKQQWKGNAKQHSSDSMISACDQMILMPIVLGDRVLKKTPSGA